MKKQRILCKVLLSASVIATSLSTTGFTPILAQEIVTENEGITITKQPSSKVAVKVGTKPAISVAVSGGEGTISYQWYLKKKGAASFSIWGGQTGSSITANAVEGWEGMQVYCIIKDTKGHQVQSNTCTITIGTPLEIIKQPLDIVVAVGKRPALSLEARGDGLTYQWYIKKTTMSKFAEWGGQTSNKITTEANSTWEGMKVYCIVKDSHGLSVQSDTITIKLGTAIEILKHPLDCVVAEGKRPSMSIEAVGEGLSLTYQWYLKKTTATQFIPWSGQTTNKVTATANSTWEGMQAYCRVTDQFGNFVNSDTATFTIGTAIEILKQPMDTIVPVGQRPALSIAASGEGLTYQWFIKKTTATQFSAWAGQTSNKVTATATSTWDGMQVYCQVTDKNGRSVNSDTVTITIGTAINILKQPEDVLVKDGRVPSISVTAEGDTLTYQWYLKKPSNSVFSPWAGQTSNKVTATANSTWTGMQVYCKITDKNGRSVMTDTITITVGNGVDITAQPKDAKVVVDKQPGIFVNATGDGTLTYQWYLKKTTASQFSAWTGQTSNKITANAVTSWDGMQVYCVVTDSNGHKATSDTATITVVDSIAISKQPTSVTVNKVGDKANFTITATGYNIKYSWQQSKDGGKTWTEVGTAETLQLTTTEEMDQSKVKCEITDGLNNKVTSSIVTLTVHFIKVTSEPVDAKVKEGQTASFKVVATGQNLTYKWQVSEDEGKTWKDMTCTTNELKVVASVDLVENQYRCIVKDSYGNEKTTAAAKLTVIIDKDVDKDETELLNEAKDGEAVEESKEAEEVKETEEPVEEETETTLAAEEPVVEETTEE